jgi:predicted DNA-binding helix-hairpin-helix protein
MIVGATLASDREIIFNASHLYKAYKLRRVYYTGFSPYPLADSRLPLHATPLLREHRLYQADWLMRFYGFNVDELTTEASPDLTLSSDPKTAWAERHPEFFPVDVNTAPREALLRVPGIGYQNVERILRIRRYHRLILEDLRKLNIRVRQALAFLVTADHVPTHETIGDAQVLSRRKGRPGAHPLQLELFAAASALTGQV